MQKLKNWVENKMNYNQLDLLNPEQNIDDEEFLIMINKVVDNIESALTGVESNMTLMFGGFGLSGIPENSIEDFQKKHFWTNMYL